MKGCQVTVENVTKSFGAFQALKGVSFSIKKGEFFSLLGPSGCGKTTLLRLIAGFDDPTIGDIRLDGASVLPLPSNKRHVNTVFQSYALFPHLSVFENVAFPLRLKKKTKRSIRAAVDEYLTMVRLGEHRDKFPSQLSGGQKQRVAIARALVKQPTLVLADEPTANLDSANGAAIIALMRQMQAGQRTTFIFSTHDPQLMSHSEETFVIRDGTLLEHRAEDASIVIANERARLGTAGGSGAEAHSHPDHQAGDTA